MAREIINVGAAPNDGQGDPIRTAFTKTNNNFGELYSRIQTVPPIALTGSVGDVAGMTAYTQNITIIVLQITTGHLTFGDKFQMPNRPISLLCRQPATSQPVITLVTAANSLG